MTDQQLQRRNTAGMFFGLMIMLFGVFLLLDQLGIADGLTRGSFGPVIVITIGLIKLSYPREGGRRREGGWWVFFGVWLLLDQLQIMRMRETWPLLLVALGVSMIWKEARPRARVE